jgi:hypothetical protein
MTTIERNDLLNIMSDMHKDAYGFRPRHINYSVFTDAELEAECDYYQEVMESNEKLETIRLEDDIKAFDKLVQQTIEMGAGNRKTALRWIVDGADDWDSEAIVWNMGLLHSDTGRALVKEINEDCNDILNKVFES